MKLKYERFEGLACFSIRGSIEARDVKILEVGLETLSKDLQTPLLINLNLALVKDEAHAELLQIKKRLPSLTKQKVHWVSKAKGIGDFAAIELFTSRLSGFKARQIGERIKLEDEVHQLGDQVQAISARVTELGGNEDRTQQIILENRILKTQEQILKNTNLFLTKRKNLQAKIGSSDDEIQKKTAEALAEIKKFYEQEYPL